MSALPSFPCWNGEFKSLSLSPSSLSGMFVFAALLRGANNENSSSSAYIYKLQPPLQPGTTTLQHRTSEYRTLEYFHSLVLTPCLLSHQHHTYRHGSKHRATWQWHCLANRRSAKRISAKAMKPTRTARSLSLCRFIHARTICWSMR